MSHMDSLVAVARARSAGYWFLPESIPAPELPDGMARTVAGAALRELFQTWGLDREHYGTPEWNPLRGLIASGSRVLLKPNWVSHRNESGAGLDCLVTHTAVIEAVLEYVALTRPSSVILG